MLVTNVFTFRASANADTPPVVMALKRTWMLVTDVFIDSASAMCVTLYIQRAPNLHQIVSLFDLIDSTIADMRDLARRRTLFGLIFCCEMENEKRRT
jgi:hypothetical protein